MSTPASDLYQQNSGVRGINSGPLIIRTYNDTTSNNTFLLGKYEVPVSSNCVLITTIGGKLAPSNAIYISSITASTITSNTLNLLSTLIISNILVSTINVSTANTNTLNASSINTSSINISTLNAFSSNISTLNVNHTTVSTMSASTITTQFLNYSTLMGSTISTNTLAITSTMMVSTLNASTATTQFINFSTAFGSSISTNTLAITSTMMVSTLNASTATTQFINFSTAFGSSISTNTLAITSTMMVSTLNASTVNTQFINFSTAFGSSISTNMLAVTSTLTVSTTTTQFINFSTAFGSTISINTLAIASTLNVSTITSRSINYSTLTGSSINTQFLAYSTLTGSTISSNTLAVTSTITASTLNASGIVSISTIQPNLDYAKFGQNWTTISSQLISTGYNGCSMSASGQYQVVINSSGGIYYTSNYGQSWVQKLSSVVFNYVAMSSSGEYVLAYNNVSTYEANMYVLSNYGQSSSYVTTGNRLSAAIAISASGQYMAVVSNANVYLSVSNNYGQSWYRSTGNISSFGAGYTATTLSASGQYMIVGQRLSSGAQQARIFTSNNYGQSWSQTMTRDYSYIHDIINSASGQYACFTYGDQVYYSNNYGYSWGLSSNVSNVYSLCMSASGQYVIAGNGTNIYYSTNYGQDWILSLYVSSDNSYTSFAISATGQYVLALSNTGANTVLYSIPVLSSPINIVNTFINPAISLSLLAPNITETLVPTITSHGIIIGQTVSVYNSFQIVYNHVGVGSIFNYLTISPYNSINGLNITANGYVGIGTIAPVSLFHVNGDININNITIGRGNSNVSTNTVMGYQAGYQITTGYNNTLLGYNAGNALTTGYQNICIGSGASASSVSVNNEITIGNGLTASSLLTIINGSNTYINRTCINGSSNPSRGIKVESYSIPVNSSLIFGFTTSGVFLLTYYPDGSVNGQSGGMAVVSDTGFIVTGSQILAPVGGITLVINTPNDACTLTSGLTVGCILSVIQIG